MNTNKTFSSGDNLEGDKWYVDNYILLKEYYDMTISRIAARCIRKGNIAVEDYEHYSYILDVLEEISETGDYIVMHTDLYEYVDRKIPGGINALKKDLNEYKTELQNNVSPDMVKQDPDEINKFKEILGEVNNEYDPTKGAGMSMDDVVNKLMKQNNIKPNFDSSEEEVNIKPQIRQPQVGQFQIRQPQSVQPRTGQFQTRQPQSVQPQAGQSQSPQPQAIKPNS